MDKRQTTAIAWPETSHNVKNQSLSRVIRTCLHLSPKWPSILHLSTTWRRISFRKTLRLMQPAGR